MALDSAPLTHTSVLPHQDVADEINGALLPLLVYQQYNCHRLLRYQDIQL